MSALVIPLKYDYHTHVKTAVTMPVLLRAARATFEHALRLAPVVVLLGARQTGKTTLLRSLRFKRIVALPH